MKIAKSHVMGAERHANEYPILIEDWFTRDRLNQFNYQAIKSILGNLESNRVIDWGCGNLLWSLGLFPGSEITGVEINGNNLGYAKVNAKANGSKFIGLSYNEVDKVKNNYYDIAVAMGLIEIISQREFVEIFSHLFNSLRPGGSLICTLHNWRAFSALYLPWIWRGGYEGYMSEIGSHISQRSLTEVERDFAKLGYSIVKSGAYNPYPSKMWSIMPNIGYVTYNKFLAHWYCSQFILLRKSRN